MEHNLLQAQIPTQKCPWHEDLERRIVETKTDIENVEKSLNSFKEGQMTILESMKIDLATIKERVCNSDKMTWQTYVTIFGVLIMIAMAILDKFLK